MKEDHDLKSFAAEALVRSKDEFSQDKEIIEKIKDKIVIIKENKQVEIVYGDSRPLIRIPLYLIGKFIAHKILDMYDDPSADIEELSQKLNMPSQAFSRPIGILLGDILEKTDKGYKVRAFKILAFLNSLDGNKIEKPKAVQRRQKKTAAPSTKTTSEETQLSLKDSGIKSLSEFLKIDEHELRKIMFFRENDVRMIDTKFVSSTDTKERQLDFSLAHLLALKYAFDLEKCPASFLRNKLKMLGIESLTNLTTNLHKYPKYIIHDAGKKGSTDNYFLITHPGEEKIKEIILKYMGGNVDNDKTQGSNN